MARLEGKVAFITGAARGQGRSHAVRLAEEGADIIAVDIAVDLDMAQTVKEVEALDRRIVAGRADVRDFGGLTAALDDGVARLGRLDIVVANAGIVSFGTAEELTEQAWRDVIDVDLTGVWLTVKAAIPHLRATGGGSITIMNSGAGLKGAPNLGHYAAAKHGVVGLMQSLANELAPDMIRVNSVHPYGTDTPMGNDASMWQMFADHQNYSHSFSAGALPTDSLADPDLVSEIVLWLASDASSLVTAAQIPADKGHLKI